MQLNCRRLPSKDPVWLNASTATPPFGPTPILISSCAELTLGAPNACLSAYDSLPSATQTIITSLGFATASGSNCTTESIIRWHSSSTWAGHGPARILRSSQVYQFTFLRRRTNYSICACMRCVTVLIASACWSIWHGHFATCRPITSPLLPQVPPPTISLLSVGSWPSASTTVCLFRLDRTSCLEITLASRGSPNSYGANIWLSRPSDSTGRRNIASISKWNRRGGSACCVGGGIGGYSHPGSSTRTMNSRLACGSIAPGRPACSGQFVF